MIAHTPLIEELDATEELDAETVMITLSLGRDKDP